MPAQFKVGSVYRDMDGDIVRLRIDGDDVRAEFLVDGEWLCHGGFFDINTGNCMHYQRCNLLPGELHNVNGQWVPVAEEAPIAGPDATLEEVMDAIADMHIAAVEPQRPELTWATPKPVDRWDGFTTNYNTEPQFEGDTHPLQRMADPSDPAHGSAWLKAR